VVHAQGKYGEAEGLFKRVLAIREKALGSRHPDVGQTLHNLAFAYTNQGKYTDAEGLYKRALVIREKALGTSHPDLAQTLNNLALVYRAQGKYSEAEGLFERALAIREKALGASHPDVAQTSACGRQHASSSRNGTPTSRSVSRWSWRPLARASPYCCDVESANRNDNGSDSTAVEARRSSSRGIYPTGQAT